MARRKKSLGFNGKGPEEGYLHREHRSKKGRRNISKWYRLRTAEYKRRRLEVIEGEMDKEMKEYG